MKRISLYIRLALIYSLRVVLRVYYIIPIKKNKIVFSSYEGKQYSCNPKYIFEYIYQHNNTYEYVWCLNDRSLLPDIYRKNGVRCVRFLSFSHILHLMTARFIISNLGIEPFIPKRRDQLFINTWHGGGAYKKCDIDMSFLSDKWFYQKKLRDLRQKATDCVISSCRAFSDNLSTAFAVEKNKFIGIGMPRNDIFFSSVRQKQNIREQVCTNLGISDHSFLILYAPTFRGNYRDQEDWLVDIDGDAVCHACASMFYAPAQFLYRWHVGASSLSLPHAVDATEYYDIQELLFACDVLITDYSSLMWDFSLQYKPCFLYAPDCDSYMKERGFYTPFEELPFPIARTNEELLMLIKNFDKTEYEKNVKNHHLFLGSYETGTACVAVYDYIHEHMIQR